MNPLPAEGQIYVSDSLIARLVMLEDNLEKVQTLNALALHYSEAFPEKALYYSKKALALANQIQSVKACAISNKVMGELFEIQHNYQPTINYYLISIKHYQKLEDEPELARLYNKLGWIYITNHFDYDQGLHYFTKALEYARNSKAEEEQATALNSIGGIFYYQADYKTALHYFNESLKTRQKLGNPKDIAASLNNIGEIYRLEHQDDLALEYYNQAVEINEKHNHQTNLAINLSNIGLIYAEKGNNTLANDYFERSIQINRQIANKAGLIASLRASGDHLNQSGEFEKAILAFNEILEIAKETSDLEGLRDATAGLAMANEGKGNISQALDYYKQHSHFKDSLFNIKKSEQLDEIQTRFALDLKEKELALKDNEIALLQREQKLNDSRQLLLLLSILLLLIVGVLAYGKLQNRNRKNKLLLSQKESLNKAREEIMQAELKSKSNELTNFALHLGEKNKFLHELKNELKNLRHSHDKDRESRIKELLINVQQNLQIQKELDEFQKTVNQTNLGFVKKLKQRFPDLTKNEERLCTMLRLNLSSKEIAALNNTSIRAVEMGRYRLRKKLKLDQNQSIIEFLQEF
ncbi:MAG: tetratricopeptide repeat protein [Bacteroidales bacterium]|nr:tetratricopeptide repeat protein [Bacteroidales bacterium]